MNALTLAEASRIVREAVKDRSYRATPLGLEVARYYRWKKNEWGATKDTMRDYEAILAKLALYHADYTDPNFTARTHTTRREKVTRDEFIRECANRSNSTPEHVLEYHEISLCECGDPGCPGWKATYLLENKRRRRSE